MLARPLNCMDLQRFIDTTHINATILPLKEKTPTVRDAARALGVQTDQIIKSLVFMVSKEPLLVINNGLNRVDRKKLAIYLGVGKSRVKFASPEQVLDKTGFQVGSMPPFGHRYPLRTLVDEIVIAQKVVFGGGGKINAMMQLETAELLKVTGADVMDLSE